MYDTLVSILFLLRETFGFWFLSFCSKLMTSIHIHNAQINKVHQVLSVVPRCRYVPLGPVKYIYPNTVYIFTTAPVKKPRPIFCKCYFCVISIQCVCSTLFMFREITVLCRSMFITFSKSLIDQLNPNCVQSLEAK